VLYEIVELLQSHTQRMTIPYAKKHKETPPTPPQGLYFFLHFVARAQLAVPLLASIFIAHPTFRLP
jgi:hypothetical protein